MKAIGSYPSRHLLKRAAFVIGFQIAAMMGASAQSTEDLLKQMQQSGGGQMPPAAPQPQTQTIEAPPAPSGTSAPSRIELILSDRAGVPLRQFGYDVFAGLNQITVPQVGAIQGYYVLGPGDALQISLRGQENASYNVIVDNEGNVALPKLAPIRAAGRTFSDFQTSLQDAVKQAYISTTAYVSVGQLRRVSVTVAGEVNSPGVKMATGLSTPLDALVLSLGVKKSGSLRNIRIIRGGRTISYDLYRVLLNDGSAAPVLLQDGDRIVVPTLGKVAAVNGWVRRPAIYELPPGSSSVSLSELLRLGGGVQVRGSFRYALSTTDAEGRLTLRALTSPSGVAQDGDILFVEQAAAARSGRFEFFGPTSLAGDYSLSTYRNLSDLLRAPGAMGEAPYMLMGVISRKDQRSLQRQLIAFAPAEVREGRGDIALQSEDIVRVFNRREASLLINAVNIYVKQVDFLDVTNRPGQMGTSAAAATDATKQAVNAAVFAGLSDRAASEYGTQKSIGQRSLSADLSSMSAMSGAAANMQGMSPANGQMQAVQAPDQGAELLQQNDRVLEAASGPFTLDQRISSQGNVSVTGELVNVAGLGQQIGLEPAVLISFLADHRVSLNGAVRGPGVYLVGQPTNMNALVDTAGGATKWADLSSVSLSRTEVDLATGQSNLQQSNLSVINRDLANIVVQPRDTLRLNPIYTAADQGTVVVQGEVRFPGSFDLVRGQRLSQLLQQAGGLTREAYPYGAVLLRKSAASLQQAGYERSANDIEKQLMMAVAAGSGPNATVAAPTGEAANFLGGMVAQLRAAKASGRVTVVVDPAALATNPEDDIALQAGDFLYIPTRPSSVTVVGEVLNPGSYPQKADRSIGDYVELAGGYGRYADKGYIYVINPDGSSRSVSSSLFKFGSERLAPGTLIVVPRDLRPFDLQQFAVSFGRILSDLAVSAASISVISR